MPQQYPLDWPLGFPRTRGRVRSPFARRPLGQAWDELLEEFQRLRAQNVLISSNLRVRASGRPFFDRANPEDSGVAVYFTRRVQDLQTRRIESKPFAIACDQYHHLWENLRALYLTIESLRRIERHGSSRLMEQAFAGFRALTAAPDHQPPWREVMGLGKTMSLSEAEARYRDLIKREDHSEGGDDTNKRRLNLAIEEARAELG